jgi:Ion channel
MTRRVSGRTLNVWIVWIGQPSKLQIPIAVAGPLFAIWCLLRLNRLIGSGATSNTWLWVAVTSLCAAIIVVSNAAMFRLFGLKNASGANVTDGLDCLYFSVVTITTVGYGDLVPAPGPARFFAACEALTGYFVLALLVNLLMNVSRRR